MIEIKITGDENEIWTSLKTISAKTAAIENVDIREELMPTGYARSTKSDEYERGFCNECDKLIWTHWIHSVHFDRPYYCPFCGRRLIWEEENEAEDN